MKQITVTWVCPKCGYTTVQPARIKGVSHPCKQRGNRPVELEREVPEH